MMNGINTDGNPSIFTRHFNHRKSQQPANSNMKYLQIVAIVVCLTIAITRGCDVDVDATDCSDFAAQCCGGDSTCSLFDAPAFRDAANDAFTDCQAAGILSSKDCRDNRKACKSAINTCNTCINQSNSNGAKSGSDATNSTALF